MTWALGDRRCSGLALAVLAALCACHPREARRSPAIGEAYVAPETLPLRREIALNSGIAATLKRGDRVEIVQRRRRFLKVRAPTGQEGWTEQGQLLTPEVHNQIGELARFAAGLPKLGVYRARDKLNLHLEPYRWSPAFFQLNEDQKVDLLARRVTERTAAPPEPVAQPAPAAALSKKAGEPRGPKIDNEPPAQTASGGRAARAAAQSANAIPPEPAPPPPAGGAPSTSPQPEKPKQYDEWYLVRTLDAGDKGHAGWALARMLDADIPDEVAQYAEGRRITSYFPLAEVTDGGQVKKIWLWTTIDRATEPNDFDSFRVFNWGRRRHRYETAYIERRIKGYFPITVAPSVKTRYGSGPGFSLVVEKSDGRRYTRSYVMLGAIVRLYAEEPAQAPATVAPAVKPAAPAPPAQPTSFWKRLRAQLQRR
jgi:hypothetical protein